MPGQEVARFTTFDAFVVFAYLIGIAWVGIWTAKRIKSSGDYFAGGRSFNKFLMVMHALGTGTHADDPVSVTGAAYQRGVAGIWYTYCYLFATPFYWIIAPIFRRLRYITTADFFERRFGRNLSYLYTVMALLTFALNMGGMLRGTGSIVEPVTGGLIPPWIAIAVMTVLFVAYGFAGGLFATVYTEGIQGLLIVVMSLLLVPFGLAHLARQAGMGGFAAMHDRLASDSFTFYSAQETTIPWIIAAALSSLIGIVAQPHIMEVCATGKTEFEGRVGFAYGNFIKRFCAMGWVWTGLIALAMYPGLTEREHAFGEAIKGLLPAGLTGLMFAAILAAQMSTLSAFMVASSALFARNLYRPLVNPEADDQTVLKVGRITGLAVVALGMAFALIIKQVAQMLTIFWTVTTLTGVFMWFGVLWRRTNRTACWCSFVVMALIWLALGPAGGLVGKLFGVFGLNAEWFGMFGDKAKLPWLMLSYLPIGVLILVAVSLLTKPEPDESLRQFQALIRTPVGQEEKLREANVDVIYEGSTTPHKWESRYGFWVDIVGFLVALAFSFVILGIVWVLTQIGAPG